ncbi:hypothetical protein X801_01575 [Opisthorchis viverrini]|uniref:Uncharacterized protein n=1 Tax=Opisthorchis viverrini TaxID=6198 RepID=A0A1S8X720_OPIVI|nr:hypothetical protein X801_01575 [Opisthorchis viverrini]
MHGQLLYLCLISVIVTAVVSSPVKQHHSRQEETEEQAERDIADWRKSRKHHGRPVWEHSDKQRRREHHQQRMFGHGDSMYASAAKQTQMTVYMTMLAVTLTMFGRT